MVAENQGWRHAGLDWRLQVGGPSTDYLEVSEHSPALIHYSHVLRRHAWIVAVAVGLALMAALLVNVLLPTQYRATSKVVVGQSGGVFQPGLGGDVQPFTQTMTQLLESDIVATTVIRNLDLETTSDELLTDINVSSAPDSSVLNVTYDSRDADQAVAVLAEIGAVFTQLVDDNLGRGVESENPITARVFDPAHLEPEPVAPRPVRNFALAGGLGLALGIVLAFVFEAFDDRVRGRRDVERWLGLPVVGMLPRGARGHAPAPLPGQQPTSRAEDLEALQLLRARLEVAKDGISGPLIVVSSALPEEGKSTVTASLGAALALAGHDVIVVEADLRRPKLQRYLGLTPVAAPGLADVLEQRCALEDALTDVPIWRMGQEPARRVRRAPVQSGNGGASSEGRLRVLLGGAGARSPSDALISDAVGSLIAELRESAEYVLIDTPPLLMVGDAFLMARLADSVMLVVREGRSRRGQVEAAKATLDSLGVTRIGVVVTDSREHAEYGYGGYAHTRGNDQPMAPTGRPAGEPQGVAAVSLRGQDIDAP